MKILFLTGMLLESNTANILDDSIGNIQNAADTLQKKYVEGFSALDCVESIKVINLSYIGSFPTRYKKIFFHTIDVYKKDSNIEYYDLSFFNLSFFKNFSRIQRSFFKSFALLKKIDKNEDVYYFIYAMHLPFLITALMLKKFYGNVKFYVIVPDLPEYMSSRTGLMKFLSNLVSSISYRIVDNLDGVVVITEAMLEKFPHHLDKIVVEGISSVSDFEKIEKSYNKGNFYLYTGTLDKRYGITDLIDSFNSLNKEGLLLYICGDGADKDYVVNAANQNPNIKYLGLLSREDVIVLQKKALLLINPRRNDGEYVKYSFPSKILEYMSSGTPVLMYKLTGIPNEYYDYVYTINSSKNGFTEALEKVYLLDKDTLSVKGSKARDFVQEFKNPLAQVSKIFRK